MAVKREAGPEGLSFSNSLQTRGEGTWVHVAGQFGTGPTGEVVSGGLAVQARAALKNVLDAVARAGGTAEHVVKITAYFTSLEEYRDYNDVRRDVFGSTLPTSTAVQVAGLISPDACIEIDAVAFIPD